LSAPEAQIVAEIANRLDLEVPLLADHLGRWLEAHRAQTREISVCGIKAHGNDGEIAFLDYEGGPPWRKMGARLAGAVNQLLTHRATGR
jgi:hypothetical protein